MSLIPAFQLHLNTSVLQGCAAIGRFDGEHLSLAAATSGGKVLLHAPHETGAVDVGSGRSSAGSQPHVRYLNINRQVVALAAGCVSEEGAPAAAAAAGGGGAAAASKDSLMVGTATNLLAYDVPANKDVFYKDIPDGISSLIVGRVVGIPVPLVIAGGNCSIQGFDGQGADQMWTVTGDNVSTMAWIDVDNDGQDELLVGSDDFEIRAYAGEESVVEIVETDRASDMSGLNGPRFSYGLRNGTLGVYNGTRREWRIKSKHAATSVLAFDLDADGDAEVISGWADGRFEARRGTNGDLVYRDRMGEAVAKLMRADYKRTGAEQCVVVASDGDVRGFDPVEAEVAAQALDTKGADDTALEELQAQRRALAMQLRAVEGKRETMKKPAEERQPEAHQIPANTSVTVEPVLDVTSSELAIQVKTNTQTVVKSAVVFSLDSQLFDGESRVQTTSRPGRELMVPVLPPRNIQQEVRVQALIGSRGTSTRLHVFERRITLPEFAGFVAVGEAAIKVEAPRDAPAGSLSFTALERPERVGLWIGEAFFTPGAPPSPDEAGCVHARFQCLRPPAPLGGRSGNEHHAALFAGQDPVLEDLVLDATPLGGDGVSSRSSGMRITVRCDHPSTTADVLQSLCKYLDIKELSDVVYSFPAFDSHLRTVLAAVQEANAVRMRLAAEVADRSNAIKTLVIRAEDSRMLGSMDELRRVHAQLLATNGEMAAEHAKRSTNHQALLTALKEVNVSIQTAARLQLGPAKARLIAAARAAVKASDFNTLFRVISKGQVGKA